MIRAQAVQFSFKTAAILLLMAAAIAPSRLVVAQSSLGGVDAPPPQPPFRQPQPVEPPARNPPFSVSPTPPPANPQPNASGDLLWGAIAFTADGSWSTAWRKSTKSEAEVIVLKQCAAFGHGNCDVATVSGQECVGLATFIGNYRRRRWLLSFTAGGTTYPEAQGSAMNRCNADERSRGNCQFRTAACADGR